MEPMEAEGEVWKGIEAELWSEKGGDSMGVEALIEAVLVKTYGTVGETQLRYETKELGLKREDDVFRRGAYIKVLLRYIGFNTRIGTWKKCGPRWPGTAAMSCRDRSLC